MNPHKLFASVEGQELHWAKVTLHVYSILFVLTFTNLSLYFMHGQKYDRNLQFFRPNFQMAGLSLSYTCNPHNLITRITYNFHFIILEIQQCLQKVNISNSSVVRYRNTWSRLLFYNVHVPGIILLTPRFLLERHLELNDHPKTKKPFI